MTKKTDKMRYDVALLAISINGNPAYLVHSADQANEHLNFTVNHRYRSFTNFMQHLSWSLSDKLSVDPFRIHEVYRRENIETLRGPDGVEHRFFIGEVKQEHLEKPFDYFHLTYVFSKIDDDRSHEIQTESIILRPLIRLGEGGSADIYIERDVKHTGWWLDPVLNQNSAEDALSFEVGV